VARRFGVIHGTRPGERGTGGPGRKAKTRGFGAGGEFHQHKLPGTGGEDPKYFAGNPKFRKQNSRQPDGARAPKIGQGGILKGPPRAPPRGGGGGGGGAPRPAFDGGSRALYGKTQPFFGLGPKKKGTGLCPKTKNEGRLANDTGLSPGAF